MHPRIPPQVIPDQGVRRLDDDRLGAGLGAVVAGARRRAVRDGDRHIDTAHLLHSLLESDPDVRAAFAPAQVARLLGYLVQRSIGYGLRWQGSVEDSGAVPVVSPAEGCSPLASLALHAALDRAARHGRAPRGGDLLAGLVAEPSARAVQVLERAGTDARELAARLDREPSTDLPEPSTDLPEPSTDLGASSR
ncbi:Clp protease N-terminal domain-containing protein [Streptomyces sp. NPDC014805]|uniref:Clp protease N-terminal domain-containing protein n=1 Tax=Streptomyces sp. NPDC014805 TaxID=3364919 RepID=UPI0036FAD9EF